MTAALDVLIVEDDVWLGQEFLRSVVAAGYRAQHSTNGHAAMDIIDQQQPRILVLDMLLGGSTGLALLHEMQSYKDTGSIPVVLCTNLAASLKLNDLRPYGVVKLLDKTTMHPDDIVAAIKVAL